MRPALYGGLHPRVRPKWHAESRVSTNLNEEMEMPKMKTKSSAKKRFKMTATGKVKAAQAGKRHGMIKRTTKFIRDARGTTVLSAPDAKIIKSYMPYDR
jgi:large subunit ribosomal protein L35